ncbi:MAG TPA: Bcr/CflA family multidrug efflux MFS transporter [Burkholderiales bacterium]|nr:Bcr/CflA family multidrug efflux MFS transporter [Burkholderiales bacterium]
MREGVKAKVDTGIARLTLVLGAVMATGPLAVDMYLPALPGIASEYAVQAARVQHTLSAYLFGLAMGQLLFGPLADRFGRKGPMLAGLGLYALASVGCALAANIESFVLMRIAQALGGSSGMVVIRAIIRDRFDALQSARVLSLMMLVMGAAPILAPLAGGWILVNSSWHWIFGFQAAFALLCIGAVALFLPESHPHHRRTPSLGHALAAFAPVARDVRFLGPTLVFVFAFGGFFAYLASAPFVFIEHFGVDAANFGWYFGAGACGFIGVSQLNRRLVMRGGPRRVLGWGVRLLAAAAAALLVSALLNLGFAFVIAPIYVAVASLGLIASNASAVAMQPFAANAGGAASLLGSSQSLVGVLASAAVGAVPAAPPVPMAVIIAACAAIALLSYELLVRKAG